LLLLKTGKRNKATHLRLRRHRRLNLLRHRRQQLLRHLR
jgi:hypothetical protein